MPEKAEKEGSTIALGKDSVPLKIAVTTFTCTNEKCGRLLTVILDFGGDGLRIAKSGQLISFLGSRIEPEDSGTGSLVWDGKEELWLKVQSKGEDSIYQAYDEHSRRWVIPVKMGRQSLD
jgi:hypothetical protein